MPYTGIGSLAQNFGAMSQTLPGGVRRRSNGSFDRGQEMAALAGQYGENDPELGQMADQRINQAFQNRLGNPSVSVSMGGAPALGVQYRAGGGAGQRTRGIAQNMQRVRMMPQPQAFVTGGPGAEPAMPGRIGYRGQLSAEPQQSGLQWLRNTRIQGAANRGSRMEIDPVTGLSQNPTRQEIEDQLAMIAGQGDESGLGGKGVGGSVRHAALQDYYNARQSGDPAAIAKATRAVGDLKNNINLLRGQNSRTRDLASQVAQSATNAIAFPMGGMQAPATPNTPGQSVPSPYSPQNTEETGYEGQSQPQSPSAETGYEPALKKGGKEAGWHPYIVNEEGMESIQYDGNKKPTLMEGPEQEVVFGRSGTVIPHRRTMQLLKEGKMNIPHRAKGGRETRTKYSAPPIPRQPNLWESAKENVLPWLNPFHYTNIGGNYLGDVFQPLQENVPPPKGLPSFASTHSPAEIAMKANQARAGEGIGEMDTPEAMYGGNPTLDSMEESVSQPDYMGWLQKFLGSFGSQPQSVQQNTPAVSPALDLATQRIMSNRGVEQIGPLEGQQRSFWTPYGTAGVGYGMPNSGPHVIDTPTPIPVAKAAPPPSSYQEYEDMVRSRSLANRIASNKAIVDSANAADKAAGVALPGIGYRKHGGQVSRTRAMAY